MNKKPILLHIIPHAILGGTEKDCFLFINYCSDYQHKVLVLGCYDIMVEQWQKIGAHVNVLNILQLSSFKFIEILSRNVDYTDVRGILYWSTIKLPLIRYVLRNSNCKLAVHVGNPANYNLLSIAKQLVQHTYFSSDVRTCLFACSQYVQRSLKVHPYYKHFPNKESLNPVKLPEENFYRSRQISVNDEIILGMTARLDPIKDHVTVIKAFAKVIQHFPAAKLWFFGDGMLRNDLEQLVFKLGLGVSVKFWGNIDNVYDQLQKLDIFVYATTPKEGLGNAVSEAMANGLPCIISDLPMMRELADNDSNVSFFKPYDADDLASKIILLIENPALRSQLSQNAFIRARIAFNVQKYVEDRLSYIVGTKKE